MKLVKIDPPGSFCHYEAVMEMIARTGAKSFIEVGCGAGDLSLKLCRKGMRGIGVDFSEMAIAQAEENLREYIESGQYRLFHGDIHELDLANESYDLGISMMVMEHVADDANFLKTIARNIKPGGSVIVAVPGRRDCWTIEDDTVGHLRRYDRQDLFEALERAGLQDSDVWSVAVPVGNMLLKLSDYMVRRSNEVQKIGTMDLVEQTKTSGIREIPFKTVFPPVFRLILNRITLYPLFVIQRLFYRTGLGITMLGMGRVPHNLSLPQTEQALPSSR